MEVHHHPDLHHRKKNYKEYFLEFIMIFLAVTLGFFAEGLSLVQASRSVSARYLIRLSNELSIGIGDISLFTENFTNQ